MSHILPAMDWNLYRCGTAGHLTYAPQEPAIREQMSARGQGGDLWQCLRCGAFLPGEPDASGPAAHAPVVKRGKEIRSEFILRVFSVERFVRALLFGTLAIAIWQFGHSRQSIRQTFNRELPLVRTMLGQLGFNAGHSTLLLDLQRALTISQGTLTLIGIGLAAYALVEVVEGIGLWQARRWGEYFALVVTSAGIPYEVYDLIVKPSWAKAGFFAINLTLVLYLVISKRLLGVRGGKDAYEARLRSESVIGAAQRAAAPGAAAKSATLADPPPTAVPDRSVLPGPPNGGISPPRAPRADLGG